MILFSVAVAFLTILPAESHASDYSDALVAADKFYQNGDCVNAVNAYKKIYYDPIATEADRDLVVFRTSYCYVNLEQNDAAITGFQLVVNKYPQNDEARLRLAQSLVTDGRPLEARAQALLVKDPNYVEEATILVAQQDLELGEPQLAIEELSSINVSKNWWPIYCYWFGVAYYQNADPKKAEFYFSLAMSKSPPNLWVLSEAKNWITTIRRERPWVHGSVSFGYFSDGNVAQESILATDANGVPTQAGPNPGSYYSDTGYLVSSGISFRLFNEKKWNLYTSFSFSSPYYLNYPNYNNQVYAATVASSYKLSSFWTSDLSIKYIDTRYDNIYYQDYLAFVAGVSGPISRRLQFRVELPYTLYVDTKFARSYGANMNIRYSLPFASAFIGQNFLDTTGPYASYLASGSAAVLVSGTMFNNYESSATYFGLTIPLIRDFHVTGQASSTTVNYKGENLPSGTLQATYPSRSDHLWTYTGELGGPLISNLWFVSLSYTYSSNRSIGLQGIASSNEIADYNYTRPYWLFSTTLAF